LLTVAPDWSVWLVLGHRNTAEPYLLPRAWPFAAASPGKIRAQAMSGAGFAKPPSTVMRLDAHELQFRKEDSMLPRLVLTIAGLIGFSALVGCDHDHDHDHWDHHSSRWDHNRHDDVIVVPARGHDWNHDRDHDWGHD